jgi:hypothetical protein
LGEPAKRLIGTPEMIPLARFVPSARGWIGRPSKERLAIRLRFCRQGRVWIPSQPATAGRSGAGCVTAADLRLALDRKRGPEKGSQQGKLRPHKRHKGGQPKAALPEGIRLHRQRSMSLPEMLRDSPKDYSKSRGPPARFSRLRRCKQGGKRWLQIRLSSL